MKSRNLRGCHALITGASSGIGAALARELAPHGARLLLTARREERLTSLADQLHAAHPDSPRPLIVAGDLTDASTRARLVQVIGREWSRLDLLINNAGAGAVGPFADASEQRLRAIMEVNFFAPAELTRCCLPFLRHADRPAIVHVGSVLGHVAVPKKSEYCASKFALRGLNDAVRCELYDEGIRVIWIAPNTTRSEFFDRLIERQGAVTENRWSMSADGVARAIVRAVRRNQDARILTLSGKALVAAGQWMPRLMTRLLARFG
jgi:short-subunit dehydrogenase